LQKSGRHFQGIHLRCRKCGEQGFARSLEIAKGLAGWTRLRQSKGPRYTGLCIDCSTSDKKEK